MADNQTAARHLAKVETARLMGLAANLEGFNLRKKWRFDHVANMTGIEGGTFAFSQRIDSRTVFARDSDFGSYRKAGAYTGSPGPLVTACRRSLRGFGVASSEIATIDVMQQLGQVAQRLPNDKFQVDDAKVLCVFALARRAIQGIPIWSSSGMMGWTQARTVGVFELHWPDIPAIHIQEAMLLRELVKRGWQPPKLPAADAESTQAGVIHSPAIGIYMDVVAVIRVVYAPKDGGGMKPTLYLDRHGNRVANPRSVDVQPSVPKGPRERPA